MATHLYKDFLEKKEVYKKNVNYWQQIIDNLLLSENLGYSEYLSTNDGFGNEFYDGNPIFHFRIHQSPRAVRIIQEEIERSGVEFSAWLNRLELENETLDELVLSLELSHESALLAIELINAWVINNFSPQKMEKYIDKLFSLKELVFKVDATLQKQIA